MGVFWHVPGYDSYAYDARYGSSEFFMDIRTDGKKHFFLIDGGEGELAIRTAYNLRLFGALDDDSEIRALITHGHHDHYALIRELIGNKAWAKHITHLYMYDPASLKRGLRNNKGSGYVQAAIDILYKIKSEAEKAGIKVVYVKNKQKLNWGDINLQWFREQPTRVEDSDRYGDAYLNHGSICTWFPKFRYITSGDGPERLDLLCKKYGLRPVLIMGPHHGNCLIRVCAQWLKDHGTQYYWDNDRSKEITDFLQTGREDAIAVGMTVMNTIGDINGYIYDGKFYIIHGAKKVAAYALPESDIPNAVVKVATAPVVRNILRGKYGAGDKRVTKLITLRYSPLSAQAKVNKVISLAKAIYDGTELGKSYGREETRRKNIDKELGKGYGQLVQDYINVLAGIKESV